MVIGSLNGLTIDFFLWVSQYTTLWREVYSQHKNDNTAKAIAFIPDCNMGCISGALKGEWLTIISASLILVPSKPLGVMHVVRSLESREIFGHFRYCHIQQVGLGKGRKCVLYRLRNRLRITCEWSTYSRVNDGWPRWSQSYTLGFNCLFQW